jgi:hypothetical protein
MHELRGFINQPSGAIFYSGISPFLLTSPTGQEIIGNAFSVPVLQNYISGIVAEGKDYICFDLETSVDKTNILSHSESTVDAYLDAFQQIYNNIKSINSGIKVGFWALGGIYDYYAPTGNNGNNLTTWNNWSNAFDRLNKRYVSVEGTYTTHYLAESFDFLQIPIYNVNGSSDERRYRNYVNELLNQVSGKIARGKPIYPSVNYWNQPNAIWVGRKNSQAVNNIALSGCKKYANGMIIWDSASYIAGFRYFLTPNSSATGVASWQGISDGGFRIDVSNVPVNISGLNFTSCVNMNQVAGVITTGINTELATWTVSTGIHQSDYNIKLVPLLLGPVSFSWDSTNNRFVVINTASSGNISGFIKPPDAGTRTVLAFGSPALSGFEDRATNLYSNGYLNGGGSSLDYNNDNRPYYWDQYVESRDTWIDYAGQAYADISGLNNPLSMSNSFNLYVATSTNLDNYMTCYMDVKSGDPTFLSGSDSNSLTVKALKIATDAVHLL